MPELEDVALDYDEFVTETEFACLYKIGDDECWFPKSVIEDDDTDDNQILVKGWFAEKEGYV